MKLGYEIVGTGNNKVIVLHDWFADSTSYHGALPYLNTTSNSFIFIDLRGYGKSKGISGSYTLAEATQDVIDTIQALNCPQYHLMGYSMTGLLATNVYKQISPKPRSVVLVCPVPPQGMPDAPRDAVAFMAEAAESDDEKAKLCAHLMTSNRYGNEWAAFKVQRWRSTSVAAARVNYMYMFVRSDITKDLTPIEVPTLVITGQKDNAPHLQGALKPMLAPYFKNAVFEELGSTGHYPMQETPVSFAFVINQHFVKYRYG